MKRDNGNNKPIHPSDIKDFSDANEIERMIESWRGKPVSKVPASVKLAEALLHALKETVQFNEHLSCRLRGLENFLDKQRQRFEWWPDEVARDAELEAMVKLHRSMIRRVWEQQRTANRHVVKELLANAGGSGSAERTDAPRQNDGTATPSQQPDGRAPRPS